MIGALLLLACHDGSSTTDSATGAHSRMAVVEELLFARDLEPGVSWGFDLDDRVSASGDADGCGHPDRITPDGVAGVDNAFAGLLPALEATGASAVEPLIQDAIARGDLLLLFDVSGIDDPVDDDCVDVSIYSVAGQTPLLAPDGTVLDGQTFALPPAASSVSCVPLRGGVIEAQGLFLELDVQVLDVFLELELLDAQLHLELVPDGSMVGVFGGRVPIGGILKIVEEEDLADFRDLVTSLVTLAADIRTSDSTCDELSITFEHRAVEAFAF